MWKQLREIVGALGRRARQDVFQMNEAIEVRRA